MPDEIKQRLQDSTDKCLKCYEAWRKDEKNDDAREALQEAVHEMRKVSSRLEIEMAISERDHTKQKPMPIPQNRNAKGKGQGSDDVDGNKDQKPKKKPEQKPESKKTEEKAEG